MNVDSVEEGIKKILMDVINPDLGSEELTGETGLVGKGIGIDSVGLLELVSAIENEFGIYFEEDDLTPELFQDIRSVAAYVEQRIEGGEA